jgi:hypothetical protein
MSTTTLVRQLIIQPQGACIFQTVLAVRKYLFSLLRGWLLISVQPDLLMGNKQRRKTLTHIIVGQMYTTNNLYPYISFINLVFTDIQWEFPSSHIIFRSVCNNCSNFNFASENGALYFNPIQIHKILLSEIHAKTFIQKQKTNHISDFLPRQDHISNTQADIL